MTVYIGTSGWSYDHWQGVLYPPGAPARDRLLWYVRRFVTVEVNSTFYHWPREATFTNWYQRLPEGFQLTVKAPRGLTHAARLLAPEVWLERMLPRLHLLQEKRGVLLVQLPPAMPCDLARLQYFLQRLPPWLRVALEFRHASWQQEEVFALLERQQVAYCIMSGADLPCILRATAPFVYVRLHGPDAHHLYAGSYSDDDLRWWASRLAEWTAQGRDVFVYFNNDGDGNAVRNAEALQGIVSG
ncbi:MAG TPA: DUF72 domain-containing protein [Chloroflexota bacterium]|nr:DUF72 domain-containing protein [Chloroflexota bacterium]